MQSKIYRAAQLVQVKMTAGAPEIKSRAPAVLFLPIADFGPRQHGSGFVYESYCHLTADSQAAGIICK